MAKQTNSKKGRGSNCEDNRCAKMLNRILACSDITIATSPLSGVLCFGYLKCGKEMGCRSKRKCAKTHFPRRDYLPIWVLQACFIFVCYYHKLFRSRILFLILPLLSFYETSKYECYDSYSDSCLKAED